MATATITTLSQHLRRMVLPLELAEMDDGRLLEFFVVHRDDAAFRAMVKRHGPMVLGVCGRLLRNPQDAEDAFQATFLVLARKAASVKPRERVANWLHGVAYRIALKARALASKRYARERQLHDLPEPEATRAPLWDDVKLLLDQEVNRLPEIYRQPIILCDLQGKSIKSATRQLAWPQGTLAGRLARARALLAKRLSRRGVVLSGGLLPELFTESSVRAGVSSTLTASTVKSGMLVAMGKGMAAMAISPEITFLTKGVLRTMSLNKIKLIGLGLLAFALIGQGIGRSIHQAMAVEHPGLPKSPSQNQQVAFLPISNPPQPVAKKARPIAAWVNDVPIFDDEVYWEMGEVVAKIYKASLEPGRTPAQPSIFRMHLEKVIEKELLMQDALRTLEKNQKIKQKLKEIAAKDGQKKIDFQMRQAEIATIEEYQQFLREQGTSLESVHKSLERDTITSEYFGGKIRTLFQREMSPDSTAEAKNERFEQERVLFLRKLRDEAVVEIVGE